MDCPHCTSPTTKEQSKKSSLGYRTFRCSSCKRTFNKRTATPFNFLGSGSLEKESPVCIVAMEKEEKETIPEWGQTERLLGEVLISKTEETDPR